MACIRSSSRALPKFESYAAFETATFFGSKSKAAIERFHGIGRLVLCGIASFGLRQFAAGRRQVLISRGWPYLTVFSLITMSSRLVIVLAFYRPLRDIPQRIKYQPST
jgi:hypothetical protein